MPKSISSTFPSSSWKLFAICDSTPAGRALVAHRATVTRDRRARITDVYSFASTSRNGANGIGDIEGKVTRVGASERGQRTSFNEANGMNTPSWEADGWTALVGGNPTQRIRRSRVNDIECKVTMVGASERGQRTSFKIGCCNFCEEPFLEAA
jgi:hypothetical protein